MSAPWSKESVRGIAPTLDMAVWTRDGKRLGTVKEVQDDAFKVDAPRERDYWLSMAFVLRVSERGVEMDFDAERTDDYRLTGPGRHTSESPALDAQSESFVNTEDKELRRERMEAPQDRSGAV